MNRRAFASMAVLCSLLLVAAACGQKAGVAQVSAGGNGAQGAIGDFGGGTGDLGGGATGGGATGGGATGGGATGGATGGGATGGGATGGGATGGGATGGGATGGGATGGGATGGGATGGGGAGTRTGISADTILIGIHAPVTGAAPFPASSFNTGKDIYFQFVGKTVAGRQVKVVFKDDQFDPRTAVAVCKDMVENSKVFLLVGGGGADQITACAQYAATQGVPYLSAGVNEEGLSNLSNYFALSATYAQQSPLLAQMVQKQFAGKKLAILAADSQPFDDAFNSMNASASQLGLPVVYSSRIPKSASQSQALSIATTLSQKGAQVVYIISAPTTFLNIAAAGNGQAYKPIYIGPGISSGLNLVSNVGCGAANSVDRARFFSPFPELDVIDKLDPNYTPAYKKYGGANPDDIGIALWGLEKLLVQMFKAAGPNMSRQSLMALLQGGQTFTTGVYPPVRFGPSNHFGGGRVHLLEAHCEDPPGKYHTIGQFLSGF